MSFNPVKERQLEYQHIVDAISQVRFRSGKPARREFRASSLPYCPILDYVGYLEAKINPDSSVAYAQEFYFNVGHAVHNLWQLAMIASPKYGHLVFGNWVCPGCQKVLLHQFKPTEPCCADHWHYQELTYRYRGLNGHSDLITKVDKNNYTLWELKTVPHWFLQSNKLCSEYQMYPKSLNQAKTYAFMLRRIYGIPVTKVVIVNLSRESPSLEMVKISPVPFTDRDYRRIGRQLDKAVASRKQVTQLLRDRKKLKRPDKAKLKAVIKSRPCHSRSDYYRKMDQRWFGGNKCPIYQMGLCTKDKTKQKLPAFMVEMWRKL